MAKTKKSLIASGLAIVVCLAMLIGTTFAWFTDSVTNKGNRIEAGTLDIDLLMDKGQNGKYTSIANGTGDIFSENAGNGVLWEPGKTEIVYLAVQNKGSLALNYNILLDVTDGNPGLVGSLEYAVLDGKTAADLEAVKDWESVKAVAGVHTGDIVAGRTVAAPNGTLDEIVNGTKDETQHFALAVHMKESAGNAYQNGSITIDVNVIAKQATAETDGFGSSDYDAGAAYPVSTAAGLGSALENGGIVSVANNMTLAEGVTLTGSADTVLDLDGKAVTLDQAGIIDLKNDAQITIQGNGTIDQEMTSDLGYLVRAAGNSKVIIKDGTFIGGLTCVQAGDNATVEIYGGHFEALVDWQGTYWLLNLIDNSNAKIIVYGGTFVNFDPSHSKTENPEANFVAEGYKVVSETQANGDIWYTVVPE